MFRGFAGKKEKIKKLKKVLTFAAKSSIIYLAFAGKNKKRTQMAPWSSG